MEASLKTIFSEEYRLVLRLMIDARKHADLSQAELANLLNKPQSFVSKYERGERRLDVVELIKIARLLNVDPHTIITEVEKISVIVSGNKK